MEMKPSFFIIGAPKAATTSLASFLALHPQAGIVRSKEPNFFSNDQRYALGWDAYMALYSHCTGKKALGDASTSYCRIRYHPLTIGRIKEHVPEAKIIYMVRHPLKRMESAYIEHLCTPAGTGIASINDAIRRQPMIVDSSRYWEVFDAYRKEFDESRIKVVWFEEYIANRVAVFKDVCRFLEIADCVTPDFQHELTNSRELGYERMAKLGRTKDQVNTTWNEEARQWVINQIRDDNCRFLAHFGRPKNFWGDLF
jgi:hypothetical protein